MKALSKQETELLFETAKSHQKKLTTKTPNVYPAIRLFLTTGILRGELAGLQWENVNLDKGYIKIVNTTIDISGKLKDDTPKSQKSKREISISQNIVKMLEEHKIWANGKYVFPSISDKNGSMLPRNINRFFDAVLSECNIDISLHELRHTHLTTLAEAGIDPKTIQSRAGHANISTHL